VSFKESESKDEKPLLECVEKECKKEIDFDKEDLPLAQYKTGHGILSEVEGVTEREEDPPLAKRKRGRPSVEIFGRDLHFTRRFECKYCLFACERSALLSCHVISEHSGKNF
jgi:hypothetical protein